MAEIQKNNAVDEQEPIVMDVFHIEETIWYVTHRSDGEERGTRPILANDIYSIIANVLSGAPEGIHIYKVNIYSLNMDYLQVPYDEPADSITTVYMAGNTKFVEDT